MRNELRILIKTWFYWALFMGGAALMTVCVTKYIGYMADVEGLDAGARGMLQGVFVAFFSPGLVKWGTKLKDRVDG